ncbi:hypothetical protein WA026_003158 [Henosepilachna vigintioctopunctata]|uniref:Uncharacterized protein n=1 Tax=Henosepilachna vigintioctopunctata TaxID=420089 RepID=A0AAW1TM66_9CUCU
MKFDTIISILFLPFILGDDLAKCCGQQQKLVKRNGTFRCEVNKNQRVHSNTVNLDLLKQNKTGHCIDIYSKKIAKFFIEISTSNISFVEFVNVRYFPKCCPVGQQYNATFHSCGRGTNTQSMFSNFFSFTKIGLPHCEIISDHIFENQQNIIINNDSSISMDGGRNINSGKYCVDSTLDGKFLVKICEENSQICAQIKCIHKCCPDGQSFVKGNIFNCTDNFIYGVNLHSYSNIQDPLVSENVYCMEHQYRKRNGVDKGLYIIFFKSTPPTIEVKYSVTRWVKIVSCIFLLLTIAVYVFLPKMRNLFGKILLNYCTATFLMYLFLTISQFNPNGFNEHICILLGFCSVFSVISSFSWLNIMAIDIWISFSTPRSTRSELQERESKLLLQYCVYGWFVPLFWMFIIVVLSRISTLPESIRPYVGRNKCYLEDLDSRPGNFAYILFVILPLLIQEIINIIVFIKTAQYCYNVKKEIEKMNNSNAQSNFESEKDELVNEQKFYYTDRND